MGEKWLKCLIVVVAVSLAAGALGSCSAVHRTFSKKAVITFDANGGIVTGSGVDTGGKSDPAVYEAKCIVGDALTSFTASRDYYDFLGWFTEKDGGNKVSKGPKSDAVLYAHWESSNKVRTVEISNVSAVTAGEPAVTGEEKTDYASMLRISADDDDNEVTVSFTINKWFGQDIAFVNKKGKLKETIDAAGENLKFSDEPVTITCPLPDKKWMDHKEYSYYIKSLGNDHVDESDVTELKIVLDGQYVDFDKPIEGSMVWYGGTEASPADRTGVVLATDDDYVYAISAGGDVFDGDDAADSSIYKWKKSDVMINLADVRTDIVYDIYNAYSSRFFPTRGISLLN